jgi:hypothetical protein
MLGAERLGEVAIVPLGDVLAPARAECHDFEERGWGRGGNLLALLKVLVHDTSEQFRQRDPASPGFRSKRLKVFGF